MATPKPPPGPPITAYVQHGSGTAGPFRTEEVKQRYRPYTTINAAKRGPIKSHWQVFTVGRWRNVWVSSGNPDVYVFIDGKKVRVTYGQ